MSLITGAVGTDGYWQNGTGRYTCDVGGGLTPAKRIARTDDCINEKPKYHIFGIKLPGPVTVDINDFKIKLRTDGTAVKITGNIGEIPIHDYEIAIQDLCADEETLRESPGLEDLFQEIIEIAEQCFRNSQDNEQSVLVIDLSGLGDTSLAEFMATLFGINFLQEPPDESDGFDEQPQ